MFLAFVLLGGQNVLFLEESSSPSLRSTFSLGTYCRDFIVIEFYVLQYLTGSNLSQPQLTMIKDRFLLYHGASFRNYPAEQLEQGMET